MKRLLTRLSTATLALVTAAIPFTPTAALASHWGGSYQYVVGAPGQPANISMDRSGETIEVTGAGTFSLHPWSMTGGGQLIHRDAAGNVVVTGTWQAKQLLAFNSFGLATAEQTTSFGLPPGSEGGRLLALVQLQPDGGGPAVLGTLRIICHLGDRIPHSAEEGIRLDPFNRFNFRHQESGATLFIRQ